MSAIIPRPLRRVPGAPGRALPRRLRVEGAIPAAMLAFASAAAGCSVTTGGPAVAAESRLTCAAHVRAATLRTVTADAPLDRQWSNYVRSNTGWTGGDSIYAYAVPGTGTLWTFADSFVGGLLPGNRRQTTGPQASRILHNLFVVSGRAGFRVITGGTSQAPQPLIGPRHSPTFYLSLGGAVEGRVFQEILSVRRWVGSQSLDNIPVGAVLATFALPSFKLLSVSRVPGPPAILWGAYMTRFGPWTYVYGASAGPLDKRAYVARVAGDGLGGPWTFWDGRGWSASPAAAVPIVGHVEQEYSVTTYDGMYVLLSSDSTAPFSPTADLYFGCSPVGPFVHRQQFALTFLVGALGAKVWGDKTVYAYDALVQPALTSPGHVVLSYDQNSLYFPAVYAHASIYEPSFLDLTIKLEPSG